MKRILVVDDEEDILISLKYFLRKQGYEVATTDSCEQAMGIFSSFSPDLVLLDINVGDEDGRVMCRQIKEHAELKHIPVILISANHEELQLYADYGANNYIPKPFNQESLSVTIESTLIKAATGS
jgi:DNA-binding response OmpR family regulator